MGAYLVTGGAGFIGSALIKRLIANGHKVVCVDNLTTGHKKNIPDGADFYYGNCQDVEIYSKIPSIQYNGIFHIAGQSSGEVSFDNPVYDLRSNVESTLHLLKFAQKVNCNRFIYASSMSVYGDYLTGPVAETAATNTKSFYAIGKLTSEKYLLLYEQYGIHSTSLRFFNVYGPGQNLSNLRQGMASIYLAQILTKNHIVVHGDANRFRDFIYIDDVVEACLLCLSRPQSHGKTINIASGIKTTVSELINKLINSVKKEVTVEYSGNTPGDIYGSFADVTLAKQILNFSYQYDLDNGLRKMVKWASDCNGLNKMEIS